MDLPTLYAEAQARLLAMVAALPADGLSRPVAATPGWAVRDLVCHLSGVATDLISGNVDGAATPPWTARQIRERRERPLGDVLAEWRNVTPAVLSMLATPGKIDAAAFDLLTHEHDVRGALGMAGPSDAEAVELVVSRLAQRLGHLVAKADLPTVQLVADGAQWRCGTGEVMVTATASTVEWFRALMGRRSPGQIATYRWDRDPAPYFGLMSLFGALPATAVEEAGAPVAFTP